MQDRCPRQEVRYNLYFAPQLKQESCKLKGILT